MTTYLIVSSSGRPVAHFHDLDQARKYIEGTQHVVKYIPAPHTELVKPTKEAKPCTK